MTTVGNDGNFSKTLSGVTVAPGHAVTATATDPGGNTSEFSLAVAQGLPLLKINNVSVTEGNSGTTTGAKFTVTLTAVSAQTVTVHYNTTDNTATAPDDYTAIPDTLLTFSAGQTSKTVTVTVNGDALGENTEAFYVDLKNATNATIGDSRGIGTILDDDPPAAPVSAPQSDDEPSQ